MSIRHYNPRRRQRRGISDRLRLFLYLILSGALLLQVSYPLLDGEPLRVVTIATVYWGAAAMALHALLSFGARYALTYLAISPTLDSLLNYSVYLLVGLLAFTNMIHRWARN